MKTVFLFLRNVLSHRNLLRTEFLRILKDRSGVRVVVLSPLGDEPEFRREIESSNVHVEKWPRTKVGFWEKRLKNIKYYIWMADQKDLAIHMKHRALHGSFGYFWRYAFGRFFSLIGLDAYRMNQIELKMFRPHRAIRDLYDRYHPDLVLFTRVIATNLHVVKEAKRRGIRVSCLMESWDNLTLKGPLSVVPDRFVVWNQINKNEACKLHHFQEEDIFIAGAPHFDLYHDEAVLGEREEFFRSLNIDPSFKLVTYAANTPINVPDEIETVELIYEAIRQGEIRKPCHLLVRPHPICSPEFVRKSYARFEGKQGVSIQHPGRPLLHGGWDPTWSDMVLLARTLYHSDVVVNVGSTVTLEAAYLDTPIVCVAFDGQGRNRSYLESCRKMSDYPHFRKVVDSGGVRMAYSPQEMIQWINTYLDNPDLDREGRERIKQEQAHFLDGKSAYRTAQIVLRELGFAHGLEKEGIFYAESISRTAKTSQI